MLTNQTTADFGLVFAKLTGLFFPELTKTGKKAQ
jgi:hypothetical protein